MENIIQPEKSSELDYNLCDTNNIFIKKDNKDYIRGRLIFIRLKSYFTIISLDKNDMKIIKVKLTNKEIVYVP